jgi:hypothetical protein
MGVEEEHGPVLVFSEAIGGCSVGHTQAYLKLACTNIVNLMTTAHL